MLRDVSMRGLALFGILAVAACGGDEKDPDPNPTGLKIDRFTATPTMLAAGAKANLSWKVSGASPVTINIVATPGGPVVTESTMAEGTAETAAIAATTSFQLTATGGGKTVQQTVTVTVDASALAIVDFTATPNPAAPGSRVELSWNTTGAEQIRLLEGTNELLNSTTMVAAGAFAVTLTRASHTYRLEASNASNTVTRDITVQTEQPASIDFFRVTPSTFTGASAQASVTWTATGNMIGLTANGTAVPNFPGTNTGTISVMVTDTTRFELTAVSGGQTVRRMATIARATAEAEPNDDIATATPIMGGANGEITEGDIDVYAVTVPANGNVTVELSNGQGDCNFAASIGLLDAQGMELAGGAMFPGFLCPGSIDPRLETGAADLPAGTYYIEIAPFGEEDLGTYSLIVTVGSPGCGNGIVEASGNETCDDGNSTAGDGCSATCTYEIADMVSGIGQNRTFSGAIAANGSRVYQVTLPTDGYIAAEVGSPTVGMCAMGVDTVVEVLDGAGAVLGGNDDFEGSLCSNYQPVDEDDLLTAGTYFVRVAGYDGAAIASFEVLIRTLAAGCGNGIFEGTEQCDDGNTAAGDGCSAMCMFEVAGTVNPPMGTVALTLGAAEDLPRLIAVNVTTLGGSITATTTGPNGGACPFGTAMGITLENSTTFLGVVEGNGGCAFINPRVNQWAGNLAVGTYWLWVGAEEGAGGAVEARVTLGSPGCGNGIRETVIAMPEQCDDGNTAANDGCSATCRFEGNVVVEAEPNDAPAMATPSTATRGGPVVTLTGSIDPAADLDHFSFTVPAGQMATVEAQLYTTYGNPMSCAQGVDSVLTVLDSTGAEVASNDDSTNGLCSIINAMTTGSRLGPGTYTLLVERYSAAATIPQYFVNLRLVP